MTARRINQRFLSLRLVVSYATRITEIQCSTHLLALITPKTRHSWWVPFEIGSCRALRKELAFLLHREVPDLPSYIALGVRLIDRKSLFSWAEKLSATPGTVSVRAMLQLMKSSPLDKHLSKTRHL